MQGALDRDAPDADIWAMARGPFRDAGRGLSLGQWMLEYAAQIAPETPHRLRLDAFRQMLDAAVAPETLGDPVWVAHQFNAADLGDIGECGSFGIRSCHPYRQQAMGLQSSVGTGRALGSK